MSWQIGYLVRLVRVWFVVIAALGLFSFCSGVELIGITMCATAVVGLWCLAVASRQE